MGDETNQIKIRIPDELKHGAYSNLFLVSHTPTEFVLDAAFGSIGNPIAEVVSRVILNPVVAKKVLNALAENLQKYEEKFGTIDVHHGGPHPTYQ